MPGMNQTGPMGQGPRTGRIMGKCANKKEDSTEIENEPFGRGRRMNGQNGQRGFLQKGRGRGMGRRRGLNN